jgi:hypothetical protein
MVINEPFDWGESQPVEQLPKKLIMLTKLEHIPELTEFVNVKLLLKHS